MRGGVPLAAAGGVAPATWFVGANKGLLVSTHI